jgi:hypothetical protein
MYDAKTKLLAAERMTSERIECGKRWNRLGGVLFAGSADDMAGSEGYGDNQCIVRARRSLIMMSVRRFCYHAKKRVRLVFWLMAKTA